MVTSLDEITAVGVHALDHRDELDPLGAHLIAQKLVNLLWVISGDTVHSRQDVVLNTVLLQQADAAHDPIKGWSTASVHAENIMDVAWAIQAYPDQKVMLLEELTPRIIQKRAVRLQGVLEGHPWPTVFILECNRFAKEIQAHQRWLTSLPGYSYLAGVVGGDKLLDIGFQEVSRHTKITTRIEQLFIEEEAVCTSKIARSAAGFRKDLKAWGNVWLSH